MTTSNAKGRITRRGFFERSAGVLATAGILGGIGAAKAVPDSRRRIPANGMDGIAIIQS
ncbi:MAG: hypothetical protein WA741_23965 [Candidatus Sulfotelmatobacter sp.]